MTQATKIITEGMQNAGLLARGQTISADETSDYLGRLNNLLLLWQTQGLKLWTNYQQSLTPVLGKRDYSMGPGGDLSIAQPKRVLQGVFVDVGGSRRPLTPISREEYNRLSVHSTQGSINSYFFDKKLTLPVLYLWMTPDSSAVTGTVDLTLQRPVTQLVTNLDTIDLPEEWNMAISWGLAAEICTGQPQQITDRCEAKALVYRQMVEDWDVEDAPTLFQPDQQMFVGTGRFR